MMEIELMPQVSVIMFYLPSFINRLWTGLPRIKYKLYQH